jgi:hypothetical protein
VRRSNRLPSPPPRVLRRNRRLLSSKRPQPSSHTTREPRQIGPSTKRGPFFVLYRWFRCGFDVVAGWCLGGELDGPRVVAVWWFWGCLPGYRPGDLAGSSAIGSDECCQRAAEARILTFEGVAMAAHASETALEAGLDSQSCRPWFTSSRGTRCRPAQTA